MINYRQTKEFCNDALLENQSTYVEPMDLETIINRSSSWKKFNETQSILSPVEPRVYEKKKERKPENHSIGCLRLLSLLYFKE